MALAAIASVAAATLPPSECAGAMNNWCSSYVNCPVPLSPEATERYALKDGSSHGGSEWRCYDPSTLDANHTKYVSGGNYCSRNTELESCLAACQAGKPCQDFTPGPQPAHRSMPPAPKPLGSLNASVVFWAGDTSTDGNYYPCTRIPAILLAGDNEILAFAECRRTIGDGCHPKDQVNVPGASRDMCMKRSTDGGRSWSALQRIFPGCSQPSPVWDAVKKQVVMVMGCQSGGFDVAVSLSSDNGRTWTPPRDLNTEIGGGAGSDAGPGVGVQLSATNPHHPGRLLFIGHKGAYVEDYVWFSDDHGETFQVANSSLLKMDEAQLVELTNGDVMANMRNSHLNSCDCRGVSISKDGGSTWGPVTYDPVLISPVCQGTILRSGKSVYFANPAVKSGRVAGLVRRSDDDGKTWGSSLNITGAKQDYAYSCLTATPVPGQLGLLWETNCEGCTGESCCSVFSLIPEDF